MTQRSRLFLFTTSFILGILLVVGAVGYKLGSDIILESTQDKLTYIRRSKAYELQNDFSNLNDALITTSDLIRIKDYFKYSQGNQEQLRSWLQKNGLEGPWRSLIVESYPEDHFSDLSKALSQFPPAAIFLQAHFLAEGRAQSINPEQVAKSRANNHLQYLKYHESFHPFFLSLYERLQLDDIILIDAQGNVVYTVNKKLNLGVNLTTGVFSSSRLAQAFRWSLNAPRGSSQFFDFAPFVHFWSVPVGYLATPVFNQSNYIGTVVFQIPIQRINDILSSKNDWDGIGLKKTGEVVAFGSDGLMRNDSRLHIENPQKFIDDYKKIDTTSAVINSIKRTNTTALNLSLTNTNFINYFKKDELFETSPDYMAVSSVKSIGKITFPGNTEWIIIAKMAKQEAMLPLRGLWLLILMAATTTCLLAFAFSRYFTKKIFSPIALISSALKKVNSYNVKEMLPPQKGEFKELAENFNEISMKLLDLRSRREFLENAARAAREAFFIIEVDLRTSDDQKFLKIKDLNPAASQMLGLSIQAVKGANLQAWIDADFSQIFYSLDSRQAAQKNHNIEGVLNKINGEKIPLELSWAPIQGDSKDHLDLIITGRDISWKKELEKAFQLREELMKKTQLLSKIGSFRWDLQTGKCLWSDEEFHLFGLNPITTEPTYDLLRSLVYQDDLPLFDDAVTDAKRNIRPFRLDFRVRKKNTGEIIWVRAQGRMDYDSLGSPTVMYGTTQDITELRRVEQSLIAAKNEALKSSQAKSEFLARMSHEIRTPMNAIMGMADLLKETQLTKDQEYYVTIFCKAGEVLMALINDILDLSKIEAGEVSIENIPFDLKKLMIDVEDMMKPRAQEKGINYSFELAPGISPYLMGDPTKLRQVLINLVSNSLKFTESGYIRVSVSKNPAKKDTLLLSVSDSGVGISADKQHLIFQKFSQADSSITRRYGGTGLGLAISKSLVELMGGQIWFKSRENLGTTFFLTVPYREQIYNPVTQKPIPMQKGELDFVTPKQRDPNEKLRILIADDTEDNRTLFTHFLKSGPYEIIQAENGLEAVNKVKSNQFDIVFMDVQMPEMDGYAATGEIRKWETENHKPHTPIIALTAHALSEDRQKSLRAGCDDHIAKPFKKDTLLGVINRYSQ